MNDAVQRIVDDYRNAREENDYPAQSGILVALMRMLLTSEGDRRATAQATAQAILRLYQDTT